MRLNRQITLTTGLLAAAAVGWSLTAQSRPYPDRAGVCYFYRGDTQEMLEPCVISSGYGAGAHYAVLHWSDGVKTNITLINFCPDDDYDERGFCRYTVDDHEAEPYQRNVFLTVTTLEDSGNLSCYRVIETDNSVCYRFNE